MQTYFEVTVTDIAEDSNLSAFKKREFPDGIYVIIKWYQAIKQHTQIAGLVKIYNYHFTIR